MEKHWSDLMKLYTNFDNDFYKRKQTPHTESIDFIHLGKFESIEGEEEKKKTKKKKNLNKLIWNFEFDFE